MPEARTQSEIHRALGSLGDVRIFRNNVGLAWAGRIRSKSSGTVCLDNARPVHFGLHAGSADLIGWRTMTITPDMVGTKVAVFASVEVKTTTGRATEEQINWARRVREAGGISMIARDARGAVMDMTLWTPITPVSQSPRTGGKPVSEAPTTG